MTTPQPPQHHWIRLAETITNPDTDTKPELPAAEFLAWLAGAAVPLCGQL